MPTATLTRNLYIIKNGNGTLDTMETADIRMVRWAAECASNLRGGIEDLVRIPITESIEMESTELSFTGFHQSQN